MTGARRTSAAWSAAVLCLLVSAYLGGASGEKPVSANERRNFVDAVLATGAMDDACVVEFAREQVAWAREDALYANDEDYYEDESIPDGPAPEEVQVSRECETGAMAALLEFALGDEGLIAVLESGAPGEVCVEVARGVVAATRGEGEQPLEEPGCDKPMFAALHAAVAALSQPAAQARAEEQAELADETAAVAELRAFLLRHGVLAAAKPLAAAGVASLQQLGALVGSGALADDVELSAFLTKKLVAATTAWLGSERGAASTARSQGSAEL